MTEWERRKQQAWEDHQEALREYNLDKSTDNWFMLMGTGKYWQAFKDAEEEVV